MYVVFQSKLYARQDKADHSWTMDEDDCYLFLAILLLSGYVPLLWRRTFWEKDRDCQNPAVADVMSRNKFNDIFRSFIGAITAKSTKMARRQKSEHSILWSMKDAKNSCLCKGIFALMKQCCLYEGRHPSKQFICGKSLKYGIKLWTLVTNKRLCDPIWPLQTSLFIKHQFGIGTFSRFEINWKHLTISSLVCLWLKNSAEEVLRPVERFVQIVLIGTKKWKNSLIFRKNEPTGVSVLEWHGNNIVTLATIAHV